MPLNLPGLQADIKSALDQQKSNTGNQAEAVQQLSLKLATAIDKYIRSGLVITNPGQAVATAGSAVAQVGATSAPGTGQVT
tara:strand:+ start:407 stop:649 length:243 start_codon:yes stop_codon:yes gene_type:complete